MIQKAHIIRTIINSYLDNLYKFKKFIEKVKNMDMNEFQDFYRLFDRYENIYSEDRINRFVDTIRTNIYRFKVRQDILQNNFKPIDYSKSIGNELENKT